MTAGGWVLVVVVVVVVVLLLGAAVVAEASSTMAEAATAVLVIVIDGTRLAMGKVDAVGLPASLSGAGAVRTSTADDAPPAPANSSDRAAAAIINFFPSGVTNM